MDMIKENISIVAGGAGFIGSNLVRGLVERGKFVVVIDNFCRGSESFLTQIPSCVVINAELSKQDDCERAFSQAMSLGVVDEVWHLAANSDISEGIKNIDVDLRDTFHTTVEILRQMQLRNIKTIYFASSSAIYGDLGDKCLHEEIGPLLPISNYGAMKLASEALISAAAEAYLEKACIFRFPNVVGVPATHGVILDFIKKLKMRPNCLDVLGNGTQQKAYLHISDLISAMFFIVDRTPIVKTNVVNIGPQDKGVSVQWIAEHVVKRLNLDSVIEYGNGNKGWVGDVPRFNYSTEKINSYGWRPLLSSEQAVLRAIDEVAIQFGR
jgi:UDP-glucose 4-epimerase